MPRFPAPRCRACFDRLSTSFVDKQVRITSGRGGVQPVQLARHAKAGFIEMRRLLCRQLTDNLLFERFGQPITPFQTILDSRGVEAVR